MEDPRQIWDRRYAHRRSDYPTDPWLEPWQALLDTARSGRLLDLGCGRGGDTAYLTAQGWRMIAADYSGQALSLACRRVTAAGFVQVDLRQGLPFAANCFQGVIASLSLHYFAWEQTRSIITDLRRCLTSDGFLLARFNSVNDANYGAQGHPAVEPNYFLVDGMLKRFFDADGLKQLFAVGWQIEALAEKEIGRYGQPKIAWEIVVRKIS